MRTLDSVKTLPCLLLLTWAATAVPAQGVDLKSELVNLVNSELAFSKESLDKGMHAAFLAFLAERSIVFRPQPVDGRSFYSDGADSVELSWYPVFADISRTSDLGYTTGPYQARSIRVGQPVQHGYYVSLWGKQKDGSWKVVVDIGTENPAPEIKPIPWQAPASYKPVFDKPVSSARDLREILMEMDRLCTTVSKTKGVAAAYSGFLADDARRHIPWAQPSLSKLQILASVSPKEMLRWQPLSAEVGRGADLGYTYGRCTNLARVGHQYYLRIWKRDRAGNWKIVLEVVTPTEIVQIAK